MALTWIPWDDFVCNPSWICLLCRFGIPQSDVSRIITAFTDLIYRRLWEIQIWPSQKLVRENLPECFKEKYANTRVVIDCTEIFIQRPSSATVQQLTYSSYKSHNTAKALIGVSPNGFISFLPDIQPGRLSDKELVIRSGLVAMLEPGDLVMADRGFTIEDLLSDSVELNIPPVLHDKWGGCHQVYRICAYSCWESDRPCKALFNIELNIS